MKKLGVLLCVLFLTLFSCQQKYKAQIETVTPQEMFSLVHMDDVQTVDLRSHEERLGEGYIKNSQHINFNSETFLADIKHLDKNRPVILYCQSGNKSAKCAEKLIEEGFIKIFDLQGGISEWKHQGHPVMVLD